MLEWDAVTSGALSGQLICELRTKAVLNDINEIRRAKP